VKKRVRKKRHLGEFREWGCELEVELHSKEEFDQFLDTLVEEVEKMSCFCGGGGSGNLLSMIVELGTENNNPASRRAHIKDWLKAQPSVKSFSVGPLIDLWVASE
jgi:uncharacterized protein YggL (DUF469 family)